MPGNLPDLPNLSAEEQARLEIRNGLRQFDQLIARIEQAVASPKQFRLRPSTIMALNRYAVEGLLVNPGSYRQVPVEIEGSPHEPPPAENVPSLVEEMCEYVEGQWNATPIHLSAYLLWRLNWIHPFCDGNGRTSRAVSYLVLCARLGYRLPGTTTIPERIAAYKKPYYDALDAADAAWLSGVLDVSLMETLLSDQLAAQLIEIHQSATRAAESPPERS